MHFERGALRGGQHLGNLLALGLKDSMRFRLLLRGQIQCLREMIESSAGMGLRHRHGHLAIAKHHTQHGNCQGIYTKHPMFLPSHRAAISRDDAIRNRLLIVPVHRVWVKTVYCITRTSVLKSEVSTTQCYPSLDRV